MGQVDPELCPGCRSRSVVPSEAHPGLYVCGDCGVDGLVRMERESRLGWSQVYYVDPNRSSVRRHDPGAAKPRGSSLR